jgi:hypothetical protein
MAQGVGPEFKSHTREIQLKCLMSRGSKKGPGGRERESERLMGSRMVEGNPPAGVVKSGGLESCSNPGELRQEA